MRRRRLAPVLASAVAAGVLALAPPAAAAAATSATSAVPADKPLVLIGWTQTSAASYQAWARARTDRARWAAYRFDWSTDLCTASPDNPFGFPFHLACARHDFGYRNYRAAGTYETHKSRIDDAFHADMRRVCAGYPPAKKTACDSTAWTYYQAVKAFGIS
ncbi:phospholipase [Streptomyces sp. NPDC044571]|uniref:phospholipase n=1 Tax=Streptomyces sp. NPDC044571 TaxID=3155371 RepID=UPI0033F5FF62